MKLRSKWAELVQLMQKFMPRIASEFFATNPPDPPHWILNSCFDAFHTVWVHLGLGMKGGMEKFRSDRRRIPNVPIVFRFCRKNRKRKQEQEQEHDRNQEEGIPDQICRSRIYKGKIPVVFPKFVQAKLSIQPTAHY